MLASLRILVISFYLVESSADNNIQSVFFLSDTNENDKGMWETGSKQWTAFSTFPRV